MSLHWPKPGVNHAGEYQVSGHTLVVTGSSDRVYLNFVASSITLSNAHASSNLDFTFYDGNHEGQAFTIPNDETVRFKGKFLTFNVPVGMDALVELTNIPSGAYDVPGRQTFLRGF